MNYNLSFPELFQIELEGWCIGIEEHSDTLSEKDILLVISELHPLFHRCLREGYEFDLVLLSAQLAQAADDSLKAETLAFYILALMPHPKNLDEPQMKVLSGLIRQVDKKFGGASARMQERWKISTEND